MIAEALMTKPATDEYAADYGKYIDLVPEVSIIGTLGSQIADTLDLLSRLTEEQANYRYSPDKWSIKEIVGHLVDGERILTYRAMRFARNDRTPLPGFEQDDYVVNGAFDHQRIGDLAISFEHARAASLDLFGQLNEAAWERRGVANDSEISVRALAWIIAGHERHHKEIIRTRYLKR